MNEIDYHNAQEAIGIGQEIHALVCEYLEISEDSSKDYIDKLIYKNTNCGAWLKFTETGIRLGTIVEGSDAEFAYDLEYPFTKEDIGMTVERLEAEASEAWKEANRPTDDDIANDVNLWNEYVNPDGQMTDEQFEEMTVEARMAIIHECFGEGE